MLYQVLIAAGLLIFAANVLLNLRNLRAPSRHARLPNPAPLVSVLIPARDEEDNIRACLESLQGQDYDSFEVIVLDDNSRDDTAGIVLRMSSGDSRIRLLNGESLPQGWAGKPHACYQLARHARGDWLLFVDADTTHAPHMLRSVLALALEMKPSLLSGFPRQLAVSLPQKIAIPVLYFVIVSWLPLWWLQRSRTVRPSLAVGQFLLFPREEYWRIGGHMAVKSRILEDVWLGIEVVRRGGRHVAVDLSSVVSCSMYGSLGAMWEGFMKWAYSVASLSWAAMVGLLLAVSAFFLLPFYWLWAGLSSTTGPADWEAVAVLQVAVIFGMRWLVDARFKEPAISTLLHPLGLLFLVLASVFSAARRAFGSGVSWKRRLYGTGSGVG